MNKFKLIAVNLLFLGSFVFVLEITSSLALRLRANRKLGIELIAKTIKGKINTFEKIKPGIRNANCPNFRKTYIVSKKLPISDKKFGFLSIPNASITNIIYNSELKKSYIWNEKTGAFGNRITTQYSNNNQIGNGGILVLGGSNLRGHAINDEGTFSWILSSIYPNRKVYNFAKDGSGTVHQVLLLRDANTDNKFIPKKISKSLKDGYVILGYGPYYDQRNTLDPIRLKERFNYIKCDKVYLNGSEFKDRWSFNAPLTFIDDRGKLSIKGLSSAEVFQRSKLPPLDSNYNDKITIELIKDALINVEKLNAKPIFLLLSGSDNDKVVKWIKRSGVTMVDGRKKKDLYTWDNLKPFDSHPGYLANQKWVEKLRKLIN